MAELIEWYCWACGQTTGFPIGLADLICEKCKENILEYNKKIISKSSPSEEKDNHEENISDRKLQIFVIKFDTNIKKHLEPLDLKKRAIPLYEEKSGHIILNTTWIENIPTVPEPDR